MLRLIITLSFSITVIFLSAQATGEFDGTIQSNTLSGSGDRNVVADPNGVLKIGTTVNSNALPATPAIGDMTYFDGTNWVSVPKGADGETLTMCNCVPTWGPCPTVTLNVCDTVPGTGGAVVFWLDGNGGGLMASPVNVGTAEWGCFSLTTEITGADGTAIGTGQQNTNDILAECLTPAIAADICDNYTFGGFSDWYLPSIDELSELYLIIGPGGNNCGNFGGGLYWSSTENGSGQARVVNFWSGAGSAGFQSSSKDAIYNVRAIRAF